MLTRSRAHEEKTGKDGLIMAESNGVDLTRQGVQDIANLNLEGKREAATAALQSLGSSGANVKKEVATTALQTLGVSDVGAKTEIATTALQTLGSNADDAKKEIATTALQTLGSNAVGAKKEIATTALQTLSPEERQEVIGQVHGPTQKISDRIWQWVVGAFAIVFVGGSATLVASVFFLEVAQIQVLLTVFTTVAGILAGFISGRASASGGARSSG
jgi:hypothetical protein